MILQRPAMFLAVIGGKGGATRKMSRSIGVSLEARVQTSVSFGGTAKLGVIGGSNGKTTLLETIAFDHWRVLNSR